MKLGKFYVAIVMPLALLYAPFELTRIIQYYLAVVNVGSPFEFYKEMVAIWLSYAVAVAIFEDNLWRNS